jgi:membrane protein
MLNLLGGRQRSLPEYTTLLNKCGFNEVREIPLALGYTARAVGWLLALILLSLLFAVIYYFAPDLKTKHWHWLTPGAAVGIIGWFLASLGLRLYLHFFDNYSVTYGGLGAVIILLTWFYLTRLMLLLGAEVNSQIEAAAAKLMHTGSTTPLL